MPPPPCVHYQVMTTTKKAPAKKPGAVSAPSGMHSGFDVVRDKPARHEHAVKLVMDERGLVVQFFRRKQPWALAELMPMVESCGLVALTEETHFPTDSKDPMWLHEVICEVPKPSPTQEALGACMAVLAACMRGELQSVSLNRLALDACLGPHEIGMWQAWVAYLQQVDVRFNAWQVRRVVRSRPDLARAVWQIFAARFTPEAREPSTEEHEAYIKHELIALPTHQERVWRMLLEVVNATLRTNLWQGIEGHALAFKLDPNRVESMVGPKPWREIFVYHPLVEGIHLRDGPVARGGLRFSDRETDYRTEVLALMLAQTRKNSIVVPVGAKGGFFIRGNVDKEKFEQAYRLYVRALLSVTDTYDVNGKVMPPRRVVCKDGHDPYLVVAADKGTARMSDVANDEACKANFWDLKKPGYWLGDAFASGGSKGYDHKGMGITARGAWTSVMHHAGSLGMTPRRDRPLVLAGIGDMGGDVFGNGMLREENVALVAAFNHAHIFLDPNPDVAAAFAERGRLFAAGSGWDGYDRAKISAGGGVWPRTVKVIELSEQVQERLGVKQKQATADEVIRMILKAPVDGIWNGGIGTYVKAADETHLTVADKANDEVRVDADEIRARFIGEGGNLGVTPRARVELGLRGVKLNTDALDNSAGVSASDHEVNIKILLAQAMREGLLDEAGRLKLLRAMTDDVAALVLADNRLQNLAVTLESEEDEAYQRELMAWQQVLLEDGRVDMQVDCLPSAREMAMRQSSMFGYRYTRSEICALLSATKGWLRARLLADIKLLESDAVRPLLIQYFPEAMQAKFPKLMPKHPLAAEITATMLANLIVNRLGILAVPRLMGDFGASASDAARACAVACGVARLLPLWHQLDALKITHGTTMRVSRRLKSVSAVLSAWILRQGQPVNVAAWLKKLHGPCAEILALLPVVMGNRPEMERWRREWEGLGLPETVAARMAVLSPLVIAPDVILASEACKVPLEKVLSTHLQVGELLRLPALVARVREMVVDDVWARQAVQATAMELFLRQRRMTEIVLRSRKGLDLLRHSLMVEKYQALTGKILQEKDLTLAMLNVVLERMRELESENRA